MRGLPTASFAASRRRRASCMRLPSDELALLENPDPDSRLARFRSGLYGRTVQAVDFVFRRRGESTGRSTRIGARVQARARAVVLLSVVLDLPVAGHTVRALTRAPRVERLEVEGVPVEIFRPARPGSHPAFLFVNGAHPLRRKEPVVQRLS